MRNGQRLGEAGCPKQMMVDEESGRPMHQVVEEFADSQEVWVNAVTTAFIKMQANGYGYGEGGLQDGPDDFWGAAAFDGEPV